MADVSVIYGIISRNPGLSSLKIGILAACYYEEAQINDLAERLGVTAPAISRAVTDLQKERLVKRRRFTKDKRCVAVRTTEKGANLLET